MHISIINENFLENNQISRIDIKKQKNTILYSSNNI